eukprot:4433951-Pyramimonas_sp.AAC.1
MDWIASYESTDNLGLLAQTACEMIGLEVSARVFSLLKLDPTEDLNFKEFVVALSLLYLLKVRSNPKRIFFGFLRSPCRCRCIGTLEMSAVVRAFVRGPEFDTDISSHGYPRNVYLGSQSHFRVSGPLT